jgi:hypothetical protein
MHATYLVHHILFNLITLMAFCEEEALDYEAPEDYFLTGASVV